MARITRLVSIFCKKTDTLLVELDANHFSDNELRRIFQIPDKDTLIYDCYGVNENYIEELLNKFPFVVSLDMKEVILELSVYTE